MGGGGAATCWAVSCGNASFRQAAVVKDDAPPSSGNKPQNPISEINRSIPTIAKDNPESTHARGVQPNPRMTYANKAAQQNTKDPTAQTTAHTNPSRGRNNGGLYCAEYEKSHSSPENDTKTPATTPTFWASERSFISGSRKNANRSVNISQRMVVGCFVKTAHYPTDTLTRRASRHEEVAGSGFCFKKCSDQEPELLQLSM